MISTLQRMYRHFYFRLCDIVDSAALVESGAVDYEDLRYSANASGIWEGVATYLVIVSDYVKQYRGTGLDLPRFVRESSRFGGEEIFYPQGFSAGSDYAAIRQPVWNTTDRLAAQTRVA